MYSRRGRPSSDRSSSVGGVDLQVKGANTNDVVGGRSGNSLGLLVARFWPIGGLPECRPIIRSA